MIDEEKNKKLKNNNVSKTENNNLKINLKKDIIKKNTFKSITSSKYNTQKNFFNLSRINTQVYPFWLL